jgi:tetratricopeptide (TPR) repeat protein
MIRVCICSIPDETSLQPPNQADEPAGGEYVRIDPDNLFLALKDLEVIYGGGFLPAEWWSEVRRNRPDLLLQVGLENLMGLLEALEMADLIPPLPDDWRERFYGLLDTVEEIDEGRFDALPDEEVDHIRNDERYKLGRLFMYNLDFDRAVSFLDRAVRVNYHNRKAWSDFGFCFQKLCEYKPAAFAYQMTLHLDNHDGEAWRGLGNPFFSLGDYEMAVACYDMAIWFGSVDPVLHEQRLLVLSKLNEVKRRPH